MGVFSRIKRIVKGNINSLLDRAEDPEKALEQLVEDMKTQLVQAKENLTQSIVDEKKMTRHLENEKAQADGWRQKAGALLAAGNETSAKEALVRHKSAKELVAAKEKELESHRLQVNNLRTLVDEMNKKIELAKIKKLELTARIKAVHHAQSLSTDPDVVKEGDAFKEFQRFVDKIDEDETRAEVMREMSGQKLDEQILRHEAEKALSPEDDELEKLKAEMGLNTKKLEDKTGDKKE